MASGKRIKFPSGNLQQVTRSKHVIYGLLMSICHIFYLSISFTNYSYPFGDVFIDLCPHIEYYCLSRKFVHVVETLNWKSSSILHIFNKKERHHGFSCGLPLINSSLFLVLFGLRLTIFILFYNFSLCSRVSELILILIFTYMF